MKEPNERADLRSLLNIGTAFYFAVHFGMAWAAFPLILVLTLLDMYHDGSLQKAERETPKERV